jgi:DNA mismatch endonuclease Vsr
MLKKLRKLLPDGGFKGVSPGRSKVMKAVRSSGNRTTEMRLRMALVRYGVGGWHVQPARAEADLLFPTAKLAIFADGCFWHGCTRCGHAPIKSNSLYWAEKISHNRRKDEKITERLLSGGWKVLRFWEHEIRESPASVIARIKAEIGGR